jgi:hypothetical protein
LPRLASPRRRHREAEARAEPPARCGGLASPRDQKKVDALAPRADVRVYSREPGMPSADQPLKGFVPLLAAVAILSMVTATLRLKLEARIEARSDPPPTAMAMRPPTSPSTVRDLPSPAVFAVAIRPPESTSSFIRDLPSPAVAAIAVAKRSHQPPSPATAATTEARDLASPAAAAARAKALVERSVGIPNAKFSSP